MLCQYKDIIRIAAHFYYTIQPNICPEENVMAIRYTKTVFINSGSKYGSIIAAYNADNSPDSSGVLITLFIFTFSFCRCTCGFFHSYYY